MTTVLRWTMVAVAVAAAGGGGYWVGRRGGGGAAAPDAAAGPQSAAATPVVSVSVVPVRRGTIDEALTVYGTVVSQLGDVRASSVPTETRVTRVRVTPGQSVAAGEGLIDVEPSPATQLAIQDARNAVGATERDLAQVQQRFDQHLATNQELAAAQNALQSAKARLENLQKSGAGGPRQLNAEAAGVVSKVDVQVGQVVAAGAPLVEVAASKQIEARVGIEPGDASSLRPGQPVELTPIGAGAAKPIQGRLRLVTRQITPATHLVDAFVALPSDADLMLESFVRGQITLRSAEGLIVPRAAALPAGDAYVVYTVADGHAVRHSVRVGIDNDQEVQVEGGSLGDGDPVVVVGNYELEDGMAVTVTPAPTASQPRNGPSSAPSTAPGAASRPVGTRPAEEHP